MAKSKKTRTYTARMIGPIPDALGTWKVRMKAPHLPFYLDSEMHFGLKADADEFAKRWSKRRVTFTVEM